MTTNTWQIKCINKQPRNDPFHRITHVGGFDASAWKLTLDEAIYGMEHNGWRFFVSVDGKSVWVEIAVGPSGKKYLKTESDRSEPNNLLSLPECP